MEKRWWLVGLLALVLLVVLKAYTVPTAKVLLFDEYKAVAVLSTDIGLYKISNIRTSSEGRAYADLEGKNYVVEVSDLLGEEAPSPDLTDLVKAEATFYSGGTVQFLLAGVRHPAVDILHDKHGNCYATYGEYLKLVVIDCAEEF